MQQKGIAHLFVTDTHGAIIGLNQQQGYRRHSEIFACGAALGDTQRQTPGEVIRHNAILPYLITTLINSGAKPANINHLTTIVIETILQKLIEFAIAELGPPPVRFAFLVFGSEGRQEQTLTTDQDNAIIFEDPAPEPRRIGCSGIFHQAGHHGLQMAEPGRVPLSAMATTWRKTPSGASR